MSDATLLLHTVLSPRPAGMLDGLGDLLRWALLAGISVMTFSAVVVGAASRLGLRQDRRGGTLRAAEVGCAVPRHGSTWSGLDVGAWTERVPLTGSTVNAAVMFTDVVGFSAAMDRDERATLSGLAGDLCIIHDECATHGGHVIKTVGDGVLAVFDEAAPAVRCARAIQRRLVARPAKAASGLHHRIGIHAGHVFQLPGEVMGATVNVAARLEKEAPADGICVSQSVIDACGGTLPGAVFRGEKTLRNISGAVPLYVVRSHSFHANILAFPPRSAVRVQCTDVTLGGGAGQA